MKKKNIKKMKNVYASIKSKAKSIDKQQKKIDQLWKKYNNISKKCDHVYPNGDSAVRGVFYMDTCKICGEMW